MHHKRRRPKNRRAGCLMCKPWKVNGATCEHFKASERRALQESVPKPHAFRGERVRRFYGGAEVDTDGSFLQELQTTE